MKILLIGLLALGSISAFSCSCERTFETPAAYEIATKAATDLGYKVSNTEIVKYVPTVMDRVSSIGATAEGNSCIGRVAGKPAHYCTEKFRGNIQVSVEGRNCELLVKVVRKKKTFRSKVLRNTCI